MISHISLLRKGIASLLIPHAEIVHGTYNHRMFGRIIVPAELTIRKLKIADLLRSFALF
jgi:hypothetical protein